MVDSFINTENVLDASEILISVDTYSIKHEIIEDADDFISELKTAFENFKLPLNSGETYQTHFDKHFPALLNATKNLYNILTDDGKDTVQKYVLQKRQMREMSKIKETGTKEMGETTENAEKDKITS